MGHKTPHQGARCGRRIEIGTRSTRRMRAAADRARSARVACWVACWSGRRLRRHGRTMAVRGASVRCARGLVRGVVRACGGSLRSDLQSIVTRGRRSAVIHRGLAARWIRCMSKYWAVLSSPGACVCVGGCGCAGGCGCGSGSSWCACWVLCMGRVGCRKVSYRAAPGGWAVAATGVRGLLWRACFDSSRKGWVRAA